MMTNRKVMIGIAACVAGLSCSGAASAGQLGHDWSGFYLGASVGYAAATGLGNAESCDSVRNLVIYDASQESICAGGYLETGRNRAYYDRDGIDGNSFLDSLLPSSFYGDDLIYWDRHRPGSGSENRSDSQISWNDGSGTGYRDDNEDEGFNFGGQLGYNVQNGKSVFGFEFDLKGFSGLSTESWQGFNTTWNSETEDSNVQDCCKLDGGNHQIESVSSISWMSTMRARLGMAMGDEGRFLPFATAGVAIVSVDAETTAKSDYSGADAGNNEYMDSPSGDGSFLQTGFVIGAGAEYALTSNVSVGLEYQYVMLTGEEEHTVRYHAQDDVGSVDIVHKVGFESLQTAMIKLNYRF